jgi:hypothetical protein
MSLSWQQAPAPDRRRPPPWLAWSFVRQARQLALVCGRTCAACMAVDKSLTARGAGIRVCFAAPIRHFAADGVILHSASLGTRLGTSHISGPDVGLFHLGRRLRTPGRCSDTNRGHSKNAHALSHATSPFVLDRVVADVPTLADAREALASNQTG